MTSIRCSSNLIGNEIQDMSQPLAFSFCVIVFLRLPCNCEVRLATQRSLYASLTCGYLRRLARLFGQAFGCTPALKSHKIYTRSALKTRRLSKSELWYHRKWHFSAFLFFPRSHPISTFLALSFPTPNENCRSSRALIG